MAAKKTPKTQITGINELVAMLKHDIIAEHEGRKERLMPRRFHMERDSNYLAGYVPVRGTSGQEHEVVFHYDSNADCFVDEFLTALGIPCEGV